MAQYIDGLLPGNRHMEIDEHLCSCAACFEVYLGVLRFQLDQESA
jgi:anti-sigma factor RsiW